MTRPTDVTAVRQRLGLGDESRAFLDEMAGLAPEPGAARLPDAASTAELLRRLRVPDAEIPEAVAALPDPGAHPELWWLLERCRHRLVTDLGGFEFPTRWPDLPRELGPVGRYFYLAVFLAALPEVRRFHAEHGVPDDISWASLGDLGLKVVRHRPLYGVGGLDSQDWFTLHFRGVLYELGRLQFNLRTVEADIPGLAPGTLGLGTHIPATGPMTPADCDAAFRRAPAFFAEHFGVGCPVATCTSWLLDDQLAEYLPADSNIIRFQRRFQLLPRIDQDDEAILRFVFHCTEREPDLHALPQRSTLERAVVAHLRSGRHWRVRTGWLEL